MRARRALAVIATASVLAACSSTTVTPAGSVEGLPSSSAEPGVIVSAERPSERQEATKRRQERTPGAVSGMSGPASGSAPRAGGPRPVAERRPAVSCQADRGSDTEGAGSAPGYADLLGACVREAGSALRLEATLAGTVPGRTPDQNTTIGIGFELTPIGGETTYVVAEARPEGWSAYLTRGNGRRGLAPEAVTVTGSTLRISVRPSDVDARGPLAWQAESNWLHATLLTTEYAFDSAPDLGSATWRSAS